MEVSAKPPWSFVLLSGGVFVSLAARRLLAAAYSSRRAKPSAGLENRSRRAPKRRISSRVTTARLAIERIGTSIATGLLA